jgi:hypothetical protein
MEELVFIGSVLEVRRGFITIQLVDHGFTVGDELVYRHPLISSLEVRLVSRRILLGYYWYTNKVVSRGGEMYEIEISNPSYALPEVGWHIFTEVRNVEKANRMESEIKANESRRIQFTW